MQVAITGASGLVGTALQKALAARGDTPRPLVRSGMPAEGEISWDPSSGRLNPRDLEGIDAIVNLSGESVAGGRWTAARKERILQSRIDSTRTLCNALASMPLPPKVLVSASAMGFYGDTGDAAVDEAAGPGDGFLAEVCQAWEAETQPAAAAGIRVVHYRIGLVLSTRGGALTQMLPAFRLGLGGVLGSGKQYMSWITLDDLVAGILHCIDTHSVSGPVNAVAPHPVTNAEFTRTLARTLRRPALLPVPRFGLKLAAGEMADELLLPSIRLTPGKLTASGFRFQSETLEAALDTLLSGKA
ncbi:MAG: TIGR01777 family protein [Candidatus Hydrogenedens sp.]|nr:TIGR01777 family protein [Candidatus Hydrogenedens sp.]